MHTLLHWLSSQMQPKYSTLFTISDVRFRQDWLSCLCELLLMPVTNMTAAPACISEAERLDCNSRYLETGSQQLWQVFRYLHAWDNVLLLALTNVHGFPGFPGIVTHTQALDIRPLSLKLVGNESNSKVMGGFPDSPLILDTAFHGPRIHAFSNSSDLW